MFQVHHCTDTIRGNNGDHRADINFGWFCRHDLSFFRQTQLCFVIRRNSRILIGFKTNESISTYLVYHTNNSSIKDCRPSRFLSQLHKNIFYVFSRFTFLPALFSSYLGSAILVLKLHFTRSSISNTRTLKVLLLHLIAFNHFFFGLPLSPSTLNSITVFITSDSSLFVTWPTNQNIFYRILSQSMLLLRFLLLIHFLSYFLLKLHLSKYFHLGYTYSLLYFLVHRLILWTI